MWQEESEDLEKVKVIDGRGLPSGGLHNLYSINFNICDKRTVWTEYGGVSSPHGV